MYRADLQRASKTDPDRLAADVRVQLEAQDNVRLISAASIWEIATKHALGKLPLREPPETFCRRALIDLCGDELAISARHALVAASLPNHHRDPFDRILIAQAIVEGANEHERAPGEEAPGLDARESTTAHG